MLWGVAALGAGVRLAQERRLALALNATTLGQRRTVLALSVVYRGCAIQVAWVVVPATGKGAWRPHWEHPPAAGAQGML